LFVILPAVEIMSNAGEAVADERLSSFTMRSTTFSSNRSRRLYVLTLKGSLARPPPISLSERYQK